ncbi:MAG: HNH endonuclease [Propionibacteriaceae bacterium]
MACWAALNQAARSLQAKGDPRSLDQIRADLLVTRITGQAEADAVSFHVNLVMPADSLLGPDQTHAYATGQGGPGTHSRPSSEDRHGLQDADGQTYADADADPDADADVHAYPYADADCHADPDVGADCHADPYADPDADADGHDYADGDADAETWPDHATHPDHATVRDEPVDLGYPDCPTWDARGETWDARWDEPAHLDGIGPITAATARALIRESPAQVWIRRLFLDPVSGIADNIDPRARNFPPRLRQLIIARDRTCRHPYCDAPIREIDHITAWTDGGTTAPDNGQGLCKRCNLVKTMPGWTT